MTLMKDRRVILGKVFSYGALGFMCTYALGMMSWTIQRGDWWGLLILFGLVAVIAFQVFVFPKWPIAMARAPYGWTVAAAFLVSALILYLGTDELLSMLTRYASYPEHAEIVKNPLRDLSTYVTFAASGLFALANIVAILITARAGNVRPDSGGSRRQE